MALKNTHPKELKLLPYNESGLYLAIIAMGGLSKLARVLSEKSGKPVSRQVIFQWKKYGKIPSWSITSIHQITQLPFELLLLPFETTKGKVLKNKKVELASPKKIIEIPEFQLTSKTS